MDTVKWVLGALAKPGVVLVPLEPEIAVASSRLPFEMHSDPADRILVATARHLGATLVTADKALLDLAKNGYFRAMDAAK
jgi:PIN domain nuclease of toxin-antitoxin system